MILPLRVYTVHRQNISLLTTLMLYCVMSSPVSQSLDDIDCSKPKRAPECFCLLQKDIFSEISSKSAACNWRRLEAKCEKYCFLVKLLHLRGNGTNIRCERIYFHLAWEFLSSMPSKTNTCQNSKKQAYQATV